MTEPYYLAFDYGIRKIGVAVGQRLTHSATPLTTISVSRASPDWAAIDHLISEWSPKAVVVGLPMPASGAPGAMTRAARGFGGNLRDRYNVHVHYMDERLSTEAADRILNQTGARLKQKKILRDQVAAQLILQSFFAQTNNDESGPD
ncbi:MAG: Holliday junction resolvase RuvX [Gammaproteobacteria bacterium]|nr:Holliday junction resolvase RuvX [Gammaproteobacteria bacterium]